MFDDSILDPSLDWDAQQQQIEQQQARVAALRKIGDAGPQLAQQQPGWTSAVTGAHMLAAAPHTSLLQAITPLAASFLADRGDRRVAQATSDLTSGENQQITDIMNTMPKGTPAQPARPAIPGTEGTPDTYGPSGGDASSTLTTMTPGTEGTPGTPATPFKAAVPATQDEITQHLAPLMKNPLGRALAMKKLEDTAINEPERQAQREQAAAVAAAALEEKRSEFGASQQQKHEDFVTAQQDKKDMQVSMLSQQDANHRMMAQAMAGRNGHVQKGEDGLYWIVKNDGTTVPAVDESTGEQLGAQPAAAATKMYTTQETAKKAAAHGIDVLDNMMAEAKKSTQSKPGSMLHGALSAMGYDTVNQQFSNAMKAQGAYLTLGSYMSLPGGPNSNRNLQIHDDLVHKLADPTIPWQNKQQMYKDVRANLEYAADPKNYPAIPGFRAPGSPPVQRRAPGGGGQGPAAAQPPVPPGLKQAPDGRPIVTSDADFALLSKGTKFVDKDGKGWTK